VDGADQIGEPGVPDRPGRRRPTTGLVVARAGNPQGQTRLLDRDSFSGELGHEHEPPFWGHHLLDRGRRLTQDLDLVLQLGDPLVGRGQSCRFHRRRGGRFDPSLDEICERQRCRHDSAIPSVIATSRTLRPDSTRSRAFRRNAAGYGLGITEASFDVTKPSVSQHPSPENLGNIKVCGTNTLGGGFGTSTRSCGRSHIRLPSCRGTKFTYQPMASTATLTSAGTFRFVLSVV
jgi:hypothetical protein